MRRVLIFVFWVILLSLPVCAMELEAPAPPDSVAGILPKEADSFGEGLWNVFLASAQYFTPSLTEAVACCLRVFGVMVLTAMVEQFAPGISAGALKLAGVAAITALLLEPSSSLISTGLTTVEELRDYGKLLLGVMASALAAQGGVNASAALYVGTTCFDTLLGAAVTAVFLPMLWIYLSLSIAHAATADRLLDRLRQLLRWMMEWALKLTLYLFTGYMTITGVVSGTADAAAGKAARLAISGMVPVVGGILSDAADTVLLSAATLGSGAGIWGILTVLALFCVPALRIGCQYLVLKMTAAAGESLGVECCAALVGDFAGMMGLLLALISTHTVLVLVSTVCFLRGVSG